ncbi:kielin/chordin-like protein [Erythrolamprus reginae]|uniref:kielin/chordin-like protein n=1 Tax=Erythrolamprus reginae TaxID=121349 RepID=UPI00396C5D88
MALVFPLTRCGVLRELEEVDVAFVSTALNIVAAKDPSEILEAGGEDLENLQPCRPCRPGGERCVNAAPEKPQCSEQSTGNICMTSNGIRTVRLRRPGSAPPPAPRLAAGEGGGRGRGLPPRPPPARGSPASPPRTERSRREPSGHPWLGIMRGCGWQLLVLPWAALALQGAWRGGETPASGRRDFGDEVLDLLEALNISRSVPGVSKTKGPNPGILAWKFRRRVPILTLPRDYSLYLLSTVQAALGFHFVARQSPGSEGTLISLASPAASKRDGCPLLQLASSTQANQLRLSYRAVHNSEPASLVFPGSSPFAHGRWAQLALNLEPRRISLYVDCQEPFAFENGRGEELLSLLLPLDLQITFASRAGDESSKFLGSWQTAEISPHGFPHRPWHCEDLPELDLFSLPYSLSEDQYLDLPEESPLDPESLPPFGPLALAETHRYQQEPSPPDLPPLGSSRSGVASLEGRIQSLEALVEGLRTMLDMVKEQNSDLLGRVKTLERCECRQGGTCFADGRHYEEGASWDRDPCTSCVCAQGKAECQLQPNRMDCRGCADGRKHGESWNPDPCWRCQCEAGTVRCQVTECPQLLCQDRYTPPGHCCPNCRQACELDGRPVEPGQVATSADGCQRCSCSEGKLLCSRIPCPPLDCSNPEEVPGECCPQCQGCGNGTARHEHGAEWTPPTDPCLRCKCQEGKAICKRRQCASLCRHPAHPLPGTCCPVCDGCHWEGHEYRSGQVVQNPDPCKRCRCVAGEVSCGQLSCPPAPCSHPGKHPEECCPTCDVCGFEGQLYQDGETFSTTAGGPCLQCQCLDGHIRCQEEVCPSTPCARPLRDPKRCCPVCTVCVFEDLEFEDGTEWTPAREPCSICTCHQGETVCHALQCPPVTCQHPARLLDSCCPQCHQCLYNQRLYSHGQEFADPDDPCQNCQCKGGTVRCSPTICPPVTCPHPERRPGSCCPACPSCLHDNQMVPDGGDVPNRLDPCQSCICTGGELVCAPRKCAAPLCAHPLPGSCCQNNCNGCSYTGKEFPNGAEFPHPTDSCRQCHCINGHVQCLSRRCPPLLCPEPTVRPQECCPQCPAPPAGCLYLGVSYKHLERFYDPSEKCRSCVCANNTITCQRQPCAPVLCSHPLQQGCCRSCDGCLYQGKELPNGEQFADPQDPCHLCSCWEGAVVCKAKACPAAECPFPVPGPCCKSCEGCEYVSQHYLSGQEFPDPQDTCGICTCLGGFVTCTKKPCFQAPCSHPLRPAGQCCPRCHDCAFHGGTVANGQAVPDPADPLCSECTCQAGSIHCMKKLCKPASCAHPVPGPCSCPLCPGCRFQGQDYGDGASFLSPHQPCEVCQCLAGAVTCQPKPCPQQCAHPVAPTGAACCPLCDGCLYEGQEHANRAVFTPPSAPCHRCSCLGGNVLCAPVVCPPASCARPSRKPGECCLQCQVCHHEGREYPEGTQWLSASDPCQECSCGPGGEASCQPAPCKATLCSHPAPGSCCPVCHDCIFEGERYAHGQPFQPESCLQCACQDGNVRCEVILCPPAMCDQPVTEPGICCPRCQGCMHEGQDRADGSRWLSSLELCQACLCADGIVTCTQIICVNSCPAQVEVPGECCPVCADCSYGGRNYGPGESFQPGGNPCEICTCQLMSDGRPHLQCHRKQCPSLLDCTQDQIQAPGPGACCPTCAQALSNCTSDLLGNEVQATQDPCYTCTCQDLTWVCAHQGCPLLSCPSAQRFTPPGSCCPVCDECVIEADGRRVSNGETWKDSADGCVSCSCHMGHVECHIQECRPLVCQEGLVEVRVPRQCCAECQDPVQNCSHLSQVFQSDQRWQVDECTACTCVSGQVHCRRQRCPPSTCAVDETPALIPGVCCPRCVPHPATCVAFGDPHYRTFDGKMIHFQGGCTYVLSRDCHGGEFSIHVTNEDRGRPGVSWTKEVAVLIGETTVQLLQDGVVLVDSRRVNLPFLKEPSLSVEPKGSTLLLNTKIGVKVLWNGRSHLEVSVPGTYKGRLCGLCGNFNSFPQDDLRMQSGHLSLSEAAFGNSWKVADANATGSYRCAEGRDADPCKESGYRSRKEANARCKVLKSPPFARCHNAVAPEPFFASCVYDLCACGSATTDDCLCEVLETYASQCRHAGVMLQWRSATLCAVGCPQERGYVFDECGPPCPKTCFNHAVPLGALESHCFKPCVPGCQCPAGLVEHQAHCILPESCPPIIHGSL